MRSSPEQLHELYRQMDPKVYESESEGRNRTAQRHLQIVQEHVSTGRLLDVGCASGLFLWHALQAGWDVVGVEPNERLYEQARERLNGRGELHCGILESVALQGGFHAITLWDVLEHVPDPSAFLVACRRQLRPTGFLFLNVPDLDSLQARVLKHRWPLLLPEHLNYFNRESLCLCAKHANLSPVRFGRRYAWFSMNYVAYRVAQHEILGAKILKRSAAGILGRALLPVSLGELYSVWQAT
jgi:SAM-dependent methyltransferase